MGVISPFITIVGGPPCSFQGINTSHDEHLWVDDFPNFPDMVGYGFVPYYQGIYIYIHLCKQYTAYIQILIIHNIYIYIYVHMHIQYNTIYVYIYIYMHAYICVSDNFCWHQASLAQLEMENPQLEDSHERLVGLYRGWRSLHSYL